MKYSMYGVLLLIGLSSCRQEVAPVTAPPAAPEQVDANGYVVEEVPGATWLHLVKLDSVTTMVMEEGFSDQGVKVGTWITYHPGGVFPKQLITYANGQYNGTYLEFDERGGLLLRASYQQNELNGYWAKYKLGRPIVEANYLNGILNGVYREYRLNDGVLQKEIHYLNGELDGPYRFYTPDGKVSLEYTYRKGKKISGGAIN